MSDPNMNSPLPSVTTGGSSYSQLLKLAWPLIVSNSFTTVQITVDRYFLSKYDPDAVSAATSAMMVFWVPFVLMFCSVNYISTFVAQYTGANRPERVGPAIWQAFYFSLIGGLFSLAMIPFSGMIMGIADHTPRLQEMERTYFECLCWMSFPNLLIAACSAFFSGRGASGTVLWINGMGMVVNAILAPLMIFGRRGFPEMGVAGAGWATVIATWMAAILGLALVFRKKYRIEFNLIKGWRFEGDLFRRLLRYGLPSGLQWMIDTLAFAIFLLLAEKFGSECLTATSLAFTINGMIFIPMIGMAQATSILVGQRLGENLPDDAERIIWKGLACSLLYMSVFALLFILAPNVVILLFESEGNPEQWVLVANHLRIVLVFIAIYSLFDSIAVVLAFGLKGAGDTFFVTRVSLILSWPIMVIPSYLAGRYDWSFYWTWGFASAYIAAQGICFYYRFRVGKWKSMRVIENAEFGIRSAE